MTAIELNDAAQRIAPYIAEIQDYPEPGVSFKDITPALLDARVFQLANDAMTQLATDFGKVDLIVSPESRGFLFGPVMADRLKCGFIPARKPGKLPRAVIEEAYGMEYGDNRIQIHCDAIQPGQRVVIADDVLATGGTAQAIARIVERAGGVVAGYVFFIALNYLGGFDLLGRDHVRTLVGFDR